MARRLSVARYMFSQLAHFGHVARDDVVGQLKHVSLDDSVHRMDYILFSRNSVLALWLLLHWSRVLDQLQPNVKILNSMALSTVCLINPNFEQNKELVIHLCIQQYVWIHLRRSMNTIRGQHHHRVSLYGFLYHLRKNWHFMLSYRLSI